MLKRITGGCDGKMAEYLLHWDRHAAMPLLRKLKGFTLVRAADGDLGALDEYAKSIYGLKPEVPLHDFRYHLPSETLVRSSSLFGVFRSGRR